MKENSKKAGIHLLEKGKRGIFRVIFSRSGLILVLLAVQVLFLFSIFHWFEAFLPHIYGGVVIFTFFMVLYLLNSAMDPTAKVTWLVVVMLLPVFGALLFLYTQKNIGHRALKKALCGIEYGNCGNPCPVPGDNSGPGAVRPRSRGACPLCSAQWMLSGL